MKSYTKQTSLSVMALSFYKNGNNNLLPVSRASRNYAFFDVDDTLVSVKTMFSFQDYWFKQHPNKEGKEHFDKDMSKRFEKNASWEELNRRYYTHFAGRSVANVESLAEEWFDSLLSSEPRLFHARVVEILRKHQNRGEEAVFVSGSFPALLRPFARYLNVRHILAIEMQVKDGKYTGEIYSPQTIGNGKAKAIDMFLKKVNSHAENCFAYGDDISDEPMLSHVGNPVVIKGGRGLEAVARERGWKIMSPI